MGELPHHHARKRFGQNFLQDQNIIQNIVQSITPKKEDHIIEIGPGLGALTQSLLPLIKHLDAIEIDRDLIPKLENLCKDADNLTIHEADALEFDFSSLKKDDSKLKIIGNLPYNISTPLLFHLIQYADVIENMHFMLQKEVVDRICAPVGIKAYGRLSVMLQYYCKVEKLFVVPPQAFKPQPKVDSAIIRLTPHEQKPFVANDVNVLEKVVKQAFSQRRKTLRNTLKELFNEDELKQLDINPQLRAEQLSVEDFVKLSNFL